MKAEIQHFFDKNENLGADIIIEDDGLQVNLLMEGMTQFRINIDLVERGIFRLKLTDHSTNEIVSVTELKDDTVIPIKHLDWKKKIGIDD